MRNHIVRSRSFTRRAVVVGGGKYLLLSALAARMYYLQVSQGGQFQTMAEGNRVRLFPVMPSRGKILDRTGAILAEGEPRYQALYDPPPRVRKTGTEKLEKILTHVAKLLEMEEEDYKKILDRLEKTSYRDTILIDDYLTWDEVAKIEVNAPDLPGVYISVPEVRTYPYGQIMSHVLGYVGLPSKEDVKDNVLYRNPDFRIGKTGLEKTLEERLQGKAGVRQVEVDALGHQIRELKTDDGTPGEDVEITIDIELQKFVVEKLTGKGGLKKEGSAAVVMDISNGDVLAMTSLPGYDSNKFVRGIDSQYWKELLEDPDAPLNNKATTLQYPPGSTFKTITSLAALEAGVITPKTRAFCPGYYELGGRRFHCWLREGHGYLNVEQAIMKSCNVFFYKLARDLGPDKMAEMARRFGYGSPTGIEISGEKSGLVPDNAWKVKTLKEPWYGGESLNMSIGQGYTLVTPIQLAMVAARLASGKKIVPRLIRDINNRDQPINFDPLEISSTTLRVVQHGMEKVVNDQQGLLYRIKMDNQNHAFAGKTGTAQVLSDKTFKYIPANREERYHSLFIGYAPITNPKYSISVVVEHGGYGSTVAAPVAKEVLEKLQKMIESREKGNEQP